MRKALFTSIVLVPALLLAFAAGAFIAVRSHWGTPIATVLVKNESDLKIDSVVITYTTCGITRKITYRYAEQHTSAPDTDEVQTQFVLCGEGSHITEVMLIGGRVHASKGSYIEGGSKVTERITKSGVVSEYTRLLP